MADAEALSSETKSPDEVVREIKEDRSWIPETEREKAQVKSHEEPNIPLYSTFYRTHVYDARDYAEALTNAVEAQDEKGKMYKIAVMRGRQSEKDGRPEYVQKIYKMDLNTYGEHLQKAQEAAANLEIKTQENKHTVKQKRGEALIAGARRGENLEGFDGSVVNLIFSDHAVKSAARVEPPGEAGANFPDRGSFAVKFTDRGLDVVALTNQVGVTIHYRARDGRSYAIPAAREFGGVGNSREMMGLQEATWGSVSIEAKDEKGQGFRLNQTLAVPYRGLTDRLTGDYGKAKELFWQIEPLITATPLEVEKVVSPLPPTTVRATVDFARPEDVEKFKRQEGQRTRIGDKAEELKGARPKTYVKLIGDRHGVVFGTTYESITNTFPVRLGGGNLPEFSVAILAETNKDGDDVVPLVPTRYADRVTLEYQTTANGSAEPTLLKFNQDGRLSAKDVERLNADLNPTSLRFLIQDADNPYSVRVTKIDYGDNGKIQGFELQGAPEPKI